MTVQIALLRAVNVGGRNMAMADLRAMVTGLGFSEVRTLLQSGNLVFQNDRFQGDELEKHLEDATETRFGFRADYLVRDLPTWDAAIAANPFPDEAVNDPSHLLVVALKGPVSEVAIDALRTAIKGAERVSVVGRHAYLVYPDGIGESKLTIQVIERHLGVRGTGRNWNTVGKLAALARS